MVFLKLHHAATVGARALKRHVDEVISVVFLRPAQAGAEATLSPETREWLRKWAERLVSPYIGVTAITLGVFWWLTLQFPGNPHWQSMNVPEVFRTYSELWAKLESGQNPYVLSGYASFNFSPPF